MAFAVDPKWCRAVCLLACMKGCQSQGCSPGTVLMTCPSSSGVFCAPVGAVPAEACPPICTVDSSLEGPPLGDDYFGPPPDEFGPPPDEFGPPPDEFGPPPDEFGPPPDEFGPPPGFFGPPPDAPPGCFGPGPGGPPDDGVCVPSNSRGLDAMIGIATQSGALYKSVSYLGEPRAMDDATIVDFTWESGDYTVSETLWDSSLWFPESNGELISLSCDDCTTSVRDVSFSFWGTAYTTLGISSNGVLEPGETSMDSSYSKCELPCESLPFREAILAYWDDLRTDSGDTQVSVQDIFDNGGGVAVTFNDQTYYGANNECEAPLTFQVQLYNNNNIRIMYAFTGLRLPEGENCGDAVIPPTTVPFDDTHCQNGATAGALCEARCVGEQLEPGEAGVCTVIRTSTETRAGWLGFIAPSCDESAVEPLLEQPPLDELGPEEPPLERLPPLDDTPFPPLDDVSPEVPSTEAPLVETPPPPEASTPPPEVSTEAPLLPPIVVSTEAPPAETLPPPEVEIVPAVPNCTVAELAYLGLTANTTAAAVAAGESLHIDCPEGFVSQQTRVTCTTEGWNTSEAALAVCVATSCSMNSLPSGAGVDASDCIGKTSTEQCAVSCNAGFTGVYTNVHSNSTFVCLSSGVFSGSISCIASICDLSSLPMDIGVDRSDCVNKTTGQSCDVFCVSGFTGDADSSAFTCESMGTFSGSIACTANICDVGRLPDGVNVTGCHGAHTFEECTASCADGYVGNETILQCGTDGHFVGETKCLPRPCDIATIPTGFLSASCDGVTFGGVCQADCRPGFSSIFAGTGTNFSCQSNGSFTGSASCQPIVVDIADRVNATWASGRERKSTVSNEVTFSVTQNAQQLVLELTDPSSEAAQAVAMSFKNALNLPAQAEAVVISAQLQRRLQDSRSLQGQQISAAVEISQLSVEDADVIANNIGSVEATEALGAHFEENLSHLHSVDIGHVSSLVVAPVAMHPEPIIFYRYVTEPPAENDDEVEDYIIAGGFVFLGLTLSLLGGMWLFLEHKKRRFGTKLEENDESPYCAKTQNTTDGQLWVASQMAEAPKADAMSLQSQQDSDEIIHV